MNKSLIGAALLCSPLLATSSLADSTVAQEAYIKPANSAANAWFGKAVAMDGDTMVVGAPSNANHIGAVFVFVRNGETCSEQAQLIPSDLGTSESDDGFSVEISGDTIVFGSP
ncbi:MAG: hypothetical protein ACI8X5_001090 [Planctomycetota bacterium]|jgi:hypothetical protein